MNFRSFKSLFAVLASFAAIAFTGVASAQSTTCASCTPHTPTSLPSLNIQVGGGATFGGFGVAVFEAGDNGDGYSLVEKDGGANTALTLSAAGGLCGTFDCSGSDNKFTFNASAFENVKAAAGAKSMLSGVQAAVVNQGGATVGANFTFTNLPTAPAPAQ